jgi:hypothetical protein
MTSESEMSRIWNINIGFIGYALHGSSIMLYMVQYCRILHCVAADITTV